MDSRKVKFSGGKLVSCSELRVGTSLRGSRAKNSNNFRIATWNVRTLLRSGAFQNVIDELDRYCIDIGALQVRWEGSTGDHLESGDFLFFYGGSRKGKLGTGIAINKKFKSAIKEIQFVNERLSYVKMAGKWYNYVFINVHCPTEDKDEETKDEFYGEFERTYDKFSTYDVEIILGDLNAKIGKKEIYRSTISKESLQEESNLEI